MTTNYVLVHVFAYPWFFVGTVGAAVLSYGGYMLLQGTFFSGESVTGEPLMIALFGLIGGLILMIFGWTKAARLAFEF
ncbi:hypothetical protein AArcSl_2143 [Halalkaliarchaeum desulfuricum]|uniref:DUF8132 domain-containing protein n=1 Tax=Halalkaliarchaeum desulfuricum TaxID=2055893 RepID=A0A343TKZ6_9EURY|nr:hypothetical protein [Halalkaliarchaeum desulfuricum]AUX09768.1 hypothetical protein AArcSl_2143 [Halalkaliarchaeum desulfuricum]